MKKLSIICGLFLVLGLMTGQAYPANYQIDIGQDGADGGGTVNLFGQTGVPVDIILENYACAPNDQVFGVQTYISVDESLVDITACTPRDDNGCDLTLSGCTEQETGVYQLICSNFSFITLGTGSLVAGTMTVDCVGQGTTVMTVADDLSSIGKPAYSDGFTSDCNLASINPTPAEVTIDQLPPPCECEIAGPTNVAADAFNPVNAQYTATQVPGTDCANTPVYAYSLETGCEATGATIDPNTGLLSVPPYAAGAVSCDVCATDTANTGVDPCCQTITIEPGATCTGEIYLGGAEGQCTCLPEDGVPDPPFNRPGRRGLALTCNDIVDLCACEDCEDEITLEWTIECDKPGAATIAPLVENCSARVTVTEELCEVAAETTCCTVTVTDTTNFWSDSIKLEIGEITVDLSEKTVTPETDSVLIDIDVTNNSNTIRALDITIADEGNNLVCNECFADPDRALNFMCTAQEQADGTCRVILFSTVNYILEGDGVVAQVVYDIVDPEYCDEQGNTCMALAIESVNAADQFNEDLCACTLPGEVCFDVCGDIYPRDCPTGDCSCGDGVVDLFDILEAVDIILGVDMGCGEPYEGTACQLDNGDVPNGMPPYCGTAPEYNNCEGDGDVDIFDLMVIIDMALGRANCCDYCSTGAIF